MSSFVICNAGPRYLVIWFYKVFQQDLFCPKMCLRSLSNDKENEDIQKICKLVGRLNQKYQDVTTSLLDNPAFHDIFGNSFVQQLCHIKISQFAWERINKIF